jgi:hypothetical protein
MQDPLMEVRTSLATTTNVTGALGSSNWGGNEIQKKIDQMIADSINRGVDLRPLVTRKPMDQLTFFWNIRSNLGSTSKAAFYSEGAAGTPYPSTKYGFYAMAKAIRSDYEVTNLMMAGSRSYYDALADEAQTALDELKLAEEKAMICGADTNAYGLASAYNGLLQLMRWHSSNGGDTEGTAANKMSDTTTVFGTARADSAIGKVLDVSYVLAGTIGTATGVLELKHLDGAIVKSNKHGGKDHERVFFCSEERVDEINRLLQPQQRFAGTLNLEGGFSVATYKNVPIVGSRYMDKNGATNTTSWDSSTDADNSMYMLDLDEIEFRVLGGVDATHVAVSGEVQGSAGYNRADAQGGYFKTYGIFVMKTFNSQVHIANLTAPA